MAEESTKSKKPKRPTAQKREIQNKKRYLINKSFKSSIRTAIRQFDATLPAGDQSAITKSLEEVYSLVDKGVKRGLYSRNAAGRTKSRLTARAKKSMA